jgi:hypothetical protein
MREREREILDRQIGRQMDGSTVAWTRNESVAGSPIDPGRQTPGKVPTLFKIMS